MNSLIKTIDLTYTYQSSGGVYQALKGINLQVNRGEFLCILGANGSGKSTLAKHFNALLLPTSGKVLIDGKDTQDNQELWGIRSKVGMVFQNPDNQIVASVVEEDVAFGLENMGVLPVEISERVDWALDRVGMKEYRTRGPHFLSGGQKQRVCIAGVIAMKPRCIVLDEPTAMLDPQGRGEVLSTIIQLNQQEQITVVLITHNMEEALLAQRVVVMDHGTIVMEGTPIEVFSQTETIKKMGLEVPTVVEVADGLRSKGIAIPPHTMSIEEMVKSLCT